MTTSTEKCSECGAPLKLQRVGGSHVCTYCGAQQQVAIDSDQLAAGLQLDLANVEEFMHSLAHSLHGHFGDRTKLVAQGGRVELFEINLDPDLFLARRERGTVVAQYKKLVRGVALRTATHPLDRWVELLAKALAAHANENARVAAVLARLRGG
ncbi:MAG TPA: hypothetical protein VMJ10_15035 [Kofleriaceae bacterium]|nr:hypothetical protein [Kofleriaceae bacterium]